MTTGVIKNWNAERGFGFFRGDGKRDVFVHASEFAKAGVVEPQRGDAFEFDTETQDDGRFRAKNLRRVEVTEEAD